LEDVPDPNCGSRSWWEAGDGSQAWELTEALGGHWGRPGSLLSRSGSARLFSPTSLAPSWSCIFNSCHMAGQPKHPGRRSLGKSRVWRGVGRGDAEPCVLVPASSLASRTPRAVWPLAGLRFAVGWGALQTPSFPSFPGDFTPRRVTPCGAHSKLHCSSPT
jgi:hypothetical protein